MIAVNFHATLREIVGSRTIQVDVEPGQSIGDVIAAAIEQHPKLQPKFFAEDGALSRYVQVFVNGRNILLLDGLDTPVPEGAAINIFPPVAGG